MLAQLKEHCVSSKDQTRRAFISPRSRRVSTSRPSARNVGLPPHIIAVVRPRPSHPLARSASGTARQVTRRISVDLEQLAMTPAQNIQGSSAPQRSVSHSWASKTSLRHLRQTCTPRLRAGEELCRGGVRQNCSNHLIHKTSRYFCSRISTKPAETSSKRRGTK